MEQPEVVTLCGSIRFAAEHLAAYTRLSLEGRVVLLQPCRCQVRTCCPPT